MKLAVIGYSGAGKSTLAKALGQRCGCGVLHLDQVQFTANWKDRDRAEALAMVERFMERDAWVIDGNYTAFLQARRLAEADQIVFLNFGRWTCLFRVFQRYRQFRRRTRDDMAEGCIEKLDAEFIWWVLRDGRTPEKRRQFDEIVSRYSEKVVILRDQSELDRYLEGFLC